MTITRKQVLALKPCCDFKRWYEGNQETDAFTLLLQVNNQSREWALWGCSHWMTKDQAAKWAIYAAELVLPFFEDKYPTDDRPRKAIEAAKTGLDMQSASDAAYAAAAAAANAADAAIYAAFDAAYADYAAANAAFYAFDAANAAAAAAANAADAATYAAFDAAYAAYAAADAEKKDISIALIKKAIEIIEEKP